MSVVGRELRRGSREERLDRPSGRRVGLQSKNRIRCEGYGEPLPREGAVEELEQDVEQGLDVVRAGNSCR